MIGLASAGGGRHRGAESAVTGTVQAFGLACGLVFLSLYQGVLAGYENLLFGSFLGITRGQVLTLAIVAALTLAFFSLAGRPLLFASVDEPVARASGVPVRRLPPPSCWCSASRSPRPHRSPVCCSCSLCSSRQPRPRN